MSACNDTVPQVLERPIARRHAQVRPQRPADGQPGAITPYRMEEILNDLLGDRL
jgi:hypothetical protein